VVLSAFVAGGTSLVWTWFAVAWTYAILLVPILLLPAALGRRDDPVLRAATFVGAASVLLSLIGFLRPAPVRRGAARRAPGPAAGDRDLAGLLGSTLWGAWLVALGVAVLRRPARPPPPPERSRPPRSTPRPGRGL
jgi:hypothetical protein